MIDAAKPLCGNQIESNSLKKCLTRSTIVVANDRLSVSAGTLTERDASEWHYSFKFKKKISTGPGD